MKSRCSWPIIVEDMKKNAFKLPPTAKHLYETEGYQKLKRRLSDQLKKWTKDGVAVVDPKLEVLVNEVRKMEARYSSGQMTHPTTRKEQLKVPSKSKSRTR